MRKITIVLAAAIGCSFSCALQRTADQPSQQPWIPEGKDALLLVDEGRLIDRDWTLHGSGYQIEVLGPEEHRSWMAEAAHERASGGDQEEFANSSLDRRYEITQHCGFADPAFEPNRGKDEYQIDFHSIDSKWYKLRNAQRDEMAYVLYWVQEVEGFNINENQREKCQISFRNFTYSPQGVLIPTVPGDLTPLLTPYCQQN